MDEVVYNSIGDDEYISSFFVDMVAQIKNGKHSKMDNKFNENALYLLGSRREQTEGILKIQTDDSKVEKKKSNTFLSSLPNYKLTKMSICAASLPVIGIGGLYLVKLSALLGASIGSSTAALAVTEAQEIINSFLPAGITFTGINSALALILTRNNSKSDSKTDSKSEKINKIRNSFGYLYRRLYEEGKMPSLNQIPLYSLLCFTDIRDNDPDFNIELLSLMVDYGKEFEKNQNTRPYNRTDDPDVVNNKVVNYISSNFEKASPTFFNSPYVNLILNTGSIPMPNDATERYSAPTPRNF